MLSPATPPPFMYSKAQPEDASDAVSLDLRRSGENHVLTLRADPDWVASRLRRGPVVIDPTVTVSANLDCSLKSTTTVDTSFCPTDHLDVGSTPEGAAIRKRRSILRFDPQGQVPQGSEILSASLRLHLTKSGGPLRIDLHELSRGFSSAVTWNRFDGVGAWAAPGGDFDPAVRASNPSVGPALGWYHWDLTGLVEDWLSGAAQNNGILLKQANEDTLVTDVEFASSEYWDTSKRPYLEITYRPPPPPPGSVRVRLPANLDCSLKSTATTAPTPGPCPAATSTQRHGHRTQASGQRSASITGTSPDSSRTGCRARRRTTASCSNKPTKTRSSPTPSSSPPANTQTPQSAHTSKSPTNRRSGCTSRGW